MTILNMVISGGQIGVDQAGLQAAKDVGFRTGGYAPEGYLTKRGPDPSLKYRFDLVELVGKGYRERTRMNVKASHVTVRLAYDWGSPGERCTRRAITDFGKQSYDIYLANVEDDDGRAEEMASLYRFLKLRREGFGHPLTINIAGNAGKPNEERIFNVAYKFLYFLFMYIKAKELDNGADHKANAT